MVYMNSACASLVYTNCTHALWFTRARVFLNQARAGKSFVEIAFVRKVSVCPHPGLLKTIHVE